MSLFALHAAEAAELTYACYLSKPWGKASPKTFVNVPVTDLANKEGQAFVSEYCPELTRPTFDFQGEIDAGAVAKFRALATFIRAQNSFAWSIRAAAVTSVVVVNSDGGDVGEALEIGRILREIHAEVDVLGNGTHRCASSCVFLLAGAVNRWPQGPVLVHRPYFSNLRAGMSQADVSAGYQKVRRGIADFLREMNVSMALLDFMDSIPPGELRRLSDSQLERFGLRHDDPVFEERGIAYQANLRGISSAAYRQRVAVAEKTCPVCGRGSPPGCSTKKFQCQEAVKWGLSELELSRRQAIAVERCEPLEPAVPFAECRAPIIRGNP